MAFDGTYRGRRVLVTGHTGFKGSWLAQWLTHLGAQVAGFSLGVPTEPSNFELLRLSDRLDHHVGDIRRRDDLAAVFEAFRPEMVFHLAAQSLVRRSFADPATTFETNAMGMVNLLECVRTTPSVRAAVLITSDKAYRNDETWWGYRETDPLGGHDPYGASKSCAELVAHSYYESFLRAAPVRIATTRAGNVIGGGDWAPDRVVPDCIRAWARGEEVLVRSPQATRPWQHVLEPISGYLWLGARLLEDPSLDGEAFNFGPGPDVDHTVAQLLTAMAARWPGAAWKVAPDASPAKEATLLKLSCDKARHLLGWQAALPLDATVAFTVDWYRAWNTGAGSLHDVGIAQIEAYTAAAAAAGLRWASS